MACVAFHEISSGRVVKETVLGTLYFILYFADRDFIPFDTILRSRLELFSDGWF
jgi:hypothetical protein